MSPRKPSTSITLGRVYGALSSTYYKRAEDVALDLACPIMLVIRRLAQLLELNLIEQTEFYSPRLNRRVLYYRLRQAPIRWKNLRPTSLRI